MTSGESERHPRVKQNIPLVRFMLMLGMKVSASQCHPSMPNLIGFLEAVLGSELLMRDGGIMLGLNSGRLVERSTY